MTNYLEEALPLIVAADAALVALIGTRIYPIELPQAPTYPAITYQIVSGYTDYHMRGASGLRNPRVQFDLYATASAGVVALERAFRAALSGFSGAVGSSPPLVVQGAFCSMELDAYEEGLERAGPRVWRKTLDFNIWFTEN